MEDIYGSYIEILTDLFQILQVVFAGTYSITYQIYNAAFMSVNMKSDARYIWEIYLNLNRFLPN